MQIKFLAWEHDLKIWLPDDLELCGIWNKGSDFRKSLTIVELNQIFANAKKGTENVEFCQYTNYEDENGAEIYKGHICNVIKKGESKRSQGVVDFKNGCFYVGDTPMYEIEAFEVIGHELEHPHLLNLLK